MYQLLIGKRRMKRANIPLRRKCPLLLITNNLQKYGGHTSDFYNSRAV